MRVAPGVACGDLIVMGGALTAHAGRRLPPLLRGAAKRIIPPGEEAQVDYGRGAPTLTANGKYKRPYLFVMTLKFSGKSFRKVVWKTSQEVWAQLHEDAWRAFGGCCQYAVLDNLKEGVLRPDIYAPELNPVYWRTAGALRRGGRSLSRR